MSVRALVLGALLSCSLSYASTETSPIPVRDFARQSEFEEAKLSPTGKYLAVTLRRDGAKILVVLRRDTLDVASVVKFNAPNEVDRFYWANDERLLVSLAVTFGAYEFPMSTGELHAVDADGHNGRMVFGQRAEDRDAPGRIGGVKDFVGGHSILHLLPNDSRHVLIATYRSNKGREQISEAALLDIYSGALRTVATAPLRDAFMLADNTGVVRFALGRNKDFDFEVHYRRDAKSPWQRVATASIDEGQLLPVAFADAPNKVYVIDSRTNDTNALSLLDLDSGAMQQLFHDPRVDLDRAALAEPDRVLYAVRYVPGTIDYYVIDEATPYAAIFKAALARFPNSSVDITSVTRDHRRALVHVVGDRDAGTFYEFDTSDASFTRVLTARRWLDPARLAPVTPVSIVARDGQTLRGYVTRSNDTSGPGPLVVMPHGGPFGVSDLPLFDDIAQLFAQYGYAVLTVNYRGSSGYGRRFLAAGFGQWDGLIQRDIADATRWAISNGVADPKRIALFGISFGAYSAVMNAMLEPDLYQCAVGISGVYDLPLMLESGDVRRRAVGRSFLRQAIGDDRAALERSSPVYNAARITVPLFIAHGTLDVRAPVEHARELRDAMAAQGRPVAYLENAHEGHGFYGEDNRTELYERALHFIGGYLSVPSPEPSPGLVPELSPELSPNCRPNCRNECVTNSRVVLLAEPAPLGIASPLASSIAVCQVMTRPSQTHPLYSNTARVLLAILALIGAGAGNATTHTYSFSDTDEYLTEANDYPRWAALVTRHAAQLIEIDACLDDSNKCPSALKGYREVVLAGRSLAPNRQIALVNRFINSRRWNIEPRRDDDWRTLEDFLQVGGDCEDYAIAKYFVLRQLGFPIEHLRVAITWDMREQDYHAVTMVNLDDSVLVLDVDGPPRRQLSNYRFLFSINESGIWDHNARTRHQNESANGTRRGAQQL